MMKGWRLNRKQRRRRSRIIRRPQTEGISLNAPAAPQEGSDAGSSRDLDDAYLRGRVEGYRRAAKRDLAGAKRSLGHSASNAEAKARNALDSAARAFWWAEDTTFEDQEHALMHEVGRWTRRNLGCWLHFNGTSYSHRCPVRIAHKRIGNSIGFIGARTCSICGDDLSECPHRMGRTYWVRGGAWESVPCRVCLQESCFRHRADRLYRTSVVSIIRHVDTLREISFVRRPAQPEARLLELPVSSTALQNNFGPKFEIGMPVSCDFCLGDCAGFEDPFREHDIEEGTAELPPDETGVDQTSGDLARTAEMS
jgi:hypothetical protein